MASSSNNSGTSDSKDSRWYFTAEQLANSPSRRHGIDADQELSFRQLTAYLIQEMGQRLQVSQLCINTAIVYMHRFYAFHSFNHFHRNGIAAASLFLAAKVEEQPRKLEHVIKVAHMCLNQEAPHPSTDVYAEQAQDLVFNENVLLQTLGFDVAIDHPHTHVVKTCHLVKACKDLAQTSYFLASNSLHLTPMCLQYRPTVVACFCIYLACKWSRWEIPQSTEGKHWFHYVDKTVTMDLLKQLTDEFIAIYEKSPARLKSKLNSIKALAQGARISEPSRNISESSNGSNQTSQAESSRRPESYSSHHRSHHSHPSASHHHHSKQQPPQNEVGEHKSSSSHKQSYPPLAGSHPNRPRQDRTQIPNETQYNVPPHGSSKQLPHSNSSRSNSSNRSSHGAIVSGSSGTTQRVSHTHDPNYHKNRSVAPPQMNPPVPSHKLMPKSIDPTRGVLKDPSGRPIEAGKMSGKHNSCSNNSNIYASNSASNIGVDMSRSMMQTQQSSACVSQQRPYVLPPGSQSSSLPSNLNQNISNRSSNNMKYEQSVQPQTHAHLNQKQSVESSFNITNTRPDEGMKGIEQMEICSPPKYPSYSQQSQITQQSIGQSLQSTSQSKPLSIFSPDWNEKSTATNPLIINNNNSNNTNNKTLGLNIKSNRDSPKKAEREKRAETPKKEKLRNDVQMHDHIKIPPGEKRTVPPNTGINKRTDVPTLPAQNIASVCSFDLKGQQSHALNFSGMKRPAGSDSACRTEDDSYKDSKVRKIEPQSPPKVADLKGSLNFAYDQPSNPESRGVKSFPTTVNGIETNPDLVSCLLKESLCNDNKFSGATFIKSEAKDSDSLSIMEPPSIMETVPQQILQTEIPIKEENITPTEEFKKPIKSEKKKKKDKHKHKEKDKSKDKEEKKKHKKDKDKHKEKERPLSSVESAPAELNPVKIKIPKDKLNLPIVDTSHPPTSGFKIKIPKDRIKGEINNFQSEENITPAAAILTPSPLKIKISKDKIENYSHTHQDIVGNLYPSGNNFHGHSSNRKKDKDRDREKEKKRSSSEYNKQNGNGTAGSSGILGNVGKAQTSNSNKIHQYSSNMSQLFGDCNDDEEGVLPTQKIPHSYLPRHSDSKHNTT